MGVYDAPESPKKEKQPFFEINPLLTNIAIFGSPMSGKTMFIKTLLVRIHACSNLKEEIYIVDFGGNLGKYVQLGSVCASFDNSNEENIKRVFRIVKERMRENVKKLKSRSYYEVVKSNSADAPPHLTLIIENINAFLSDPRFETYKEDLKVFCRDGLTKGLTVVITGRDTTGIGNLLSNFGQKIALELSAEDYSSVFGRKVLPPMRYPGRGLANIDGKQYEVQCFLPFAESEKNGLEKLLKKYPKQSNGRYLSAFEDVLTKENIASQRVREGATPYPSSGDYFEMGLDYYTHHPIVLDYGRNRGIAIYGKRQFGKTNVLRGLLESIRSKHPDYLFVYLDDGRKQLRKVMKTPIKYCSEEQEIRLEDKLRTHGFIQDSINNEVYIKNPKDLHDFLCVNGYYISGSVLDRNRPMQTLNRQPVKTVFVIDNRQFYTGSAVGAGELMMFALPEVLDLSSDRENMIIFADVFSVTDNEKRNSLNRCFSVAVLLDTISDFITNKGSKSVFGEMDAKEMKLAYAKCEVGDGYFYKIDSDELSKVKFLLSPEA